MLPTSSLVHVHDLPQIYAKPSAPTLLETLSLLKRSSYTFSPDSSHPTSHSPHGPPNLVDPEGVPRYLTSIISSSLSWIDNEEVREQIWETASARLSERSGRNAAPSMTRDFKINQDLTVQLHEPSLTEDNLGLKTWTSSLLLAKRLESLHKHVPANCQHILELGAGTGLVGIAAACLWHTSVTLTDLPEIVPNLESNIKANAHLTQTLRSPVSLDAQVLDWADTTNTAQPRYEVILSADPIYSPAHPALLVGTVHRCLAPTASARFIVELPLRKGYEKEREDLQQRLQQAMEVVEEGTEVGYDDWEGANGLPAEVECWWSVWRWKEPKIETTQQSSS